YIIENLPQFSDSAKIFSQGWLEQNSPDNLLKTLLSSQNTIKLDNIASNKSPIEINHQIVSNDTPETVSKILLVIESDFL
ncbi:hypothetical protein, partial [Crocosphaera watsonii]